MKSHAYMIHTNENNSTFTTRKEDEQQKISFLISSISTWKDVMNTLSFDKFFWIIYKNNILAN